MDIVFITDNNYVFPTRVAIKSLITNKKSNVVYCINIICVELDEKNINALKSLDKIDKNVSVILINKDNIYNDIQKYSYVSQSALYKFQLANIFENLDKILYLDADIIVEKDLSELYNTNIDGLYAAVVSDYWSVQFINTNGRINHKDYFNSGVMLLNLKKMRENNISEKLIEIKRREKELNLIGYMDQDILNIGFEEKVKYLSPIYNFILYNTKFCNKDNLPEFFKLVPDNLKKNTVIFHFAGINKPWNNITYEEESQLFWKYADNIDILEMSKKLIKKEKEDLTKYFDEKNSILNQTITFAFNEINILKNEIAVLNKMQINLYKKYPKWFCNLICLFIAKKKNRHHFREKYCKKLVNNNIFNDQTFPTISDEKSNILENPNPHICKFKGIGQTEIAYIHECYWANVFRDTIQNSEWLSNKSFSPGRAALSYVSLYVLYRILNDIKPLNILEYGLGQSSRMTIQYADFYKKDLIIFEDNKEWLEFFSLQFPTAGQYTKIYELDYINIDPIEKSRVYKGFETDIKDKIFDLIIVDGPVGSKRYSRSQLLSFLNYIDPNNFIILLDDYNRSGEQDTMNMAQQILTSKNIKFIVGSYSSDKSIAVLCSANYKFVLSL